MKTSMYTGKELCQGCQKPGSEVPRTYRDQLCKNCKPCLDKGMALEVMYEPHTLVNMHIHAFRSRDLNLFIHGLLEGLHNPTAVTNGDLRISPPSFGFEGDNRKWYRVPTRCANTLLEYAIKLSDIEKALETQRETLPKLIQETLDKEKDAIYQKGVLDGQNILLQLESGALSMEDFAKNLKSYEK